MVVITADAEFVGSSHRYEMHCLRLVTTDCHEVAGRTLT